VVAILIAFALARPTATAADAGWSWFQQDHSRIRRVVPSPNFAADHLLIAAVAAGDETAHGALRSSDGGVTWQPSNNGLDERMRALYLAAAPGPTPAGTLVLTVIRRTYSKGEQAAGIFASTDGGASWTPRLANMDLWDLLSEGISPEFGTDGILLLGIRARGIFRSGDGGKSLQTANTGLTTLYPMGIAFTPSFGQDGTVYVATEGGGMYRSTDRGLSWSGANAGLDDTYLYSVAVSPDFPHDGTVLAGSGQGAVWVSTDRGRSWVSHGDGIKDQRLTTLAFSPDYAQNHTVYVGSETGGMYRSIDGGVSWAKIEAGFDTEIFSILPLPSSTGENLIVTISDGGIWVYARPAPGSPLAATATAHAVIPTPSPQPTASAVAAVAPVTGGTNGPQCVTYVVLGPVGLLAGLSTVLTVLARSHIRNPRRPAWPTASEGKGETVG
jgi:photosystem II stability/assembly factor-like uncharacterized protein